ncbi:hypothetical protein ACIP9H_40275 [Streptomyces sp. NPDC088732]|uniref:hypothetical protein n=1 Tax=Streptomyces sp. NPDC088732 TaxID=3365879 RepID=UPI003813DBD1
MSDNDDVSMVAIDGTDALAFLIIRPGKTQGSVSIESGARGMTHETAAYVLRQQANVWDRGAFLAEHRGNVLREAREALSHFFEATSEDKPRRQGIAFSIGVLHGLEIEQPKGHLRDAMPRRVGAEKRRDVLLAAMKLAGGEWTTGRVRAMYKRLMPHNLYRAAIRGDFADLCRRGYIEAHDGPRGRYYVLAGSAANAAVGFFEPGRTYGDVAEWAFRCDTITTNPADGEKTALGWRHFKGRWEPFAYHQDDWETMQVFGWCTPEGGDADA